MQNPFGRPSRRPVAILVALFASLLVALLPACTMGVEDPGNVGAPAAAGNGGASSDTDAAPDAIDTDSDGGLCGTDGIREGCPCTTAGEVIECGTVYEENGGYVTCAMGHSTCDGSTWGACVATNYVSLGKGQKSLTVDGGIFTRDLAQPCGNPCDPYNCTSIIGEPSDVDASGVYPSSEGGVSLFPSDAAVNDANCVGLQCNVISCGSGGGSTSIIGKVYDPAGKNPLYNASVYIPVDPTGTLPDFTKGLSCDTCSGAAPPHVVAYAVTGPDGSFTMPNVPSGVNIPIVVQMGKWRREIVLSSITSCVANTVVNNCTASDKSLCVLRLPRNQTDGYNPATLTYSKAELPQMAIVSGSADPLECMLLKAGISPWEFSSYNRNPNAKVHFYHSNNSPGMKLDTNYGDQKRGSELWASANPFAVTAGHYGYYDIVLDPCEGSAIDKKPLQATVAGGTEPHSNLVKYVDMGGRAFLTHFSYVWINYPGYKGYVPAPNNWGGLGGAAAVANWRGATGTYATADPLLATIITSFPKGLAFSQWLDVVDATTAPGSNQINLHEGRKDLTTVGTNTQAWMTANDNGNFNPHFTFNTPYNALPANQCGRVVFSDFHVSADALVPAGTSCTQDAQCGFGQTCKGGVQGLNGTCSEPCATNADCYNSTYACVGATTGQCLPKTCLAGGFTCSSGVCNAAHSACVCNADNQCPSGKCVNSGQTGCSAATCTGSPLVTPTAANCEPESARMCVPTTKYTCSNSKFSCTGPGACNVTTGSVGTPNTSCSNPAMSCNGTSCVCTR